MPHRQYRLRSFPTLATLLFLACDVRVKAGMARSDTFTSAGGGYRTFQIGPLADTVIRLAGTDSAQFQSSGPLTVPNEPQGLMITYYPYFDIRDTDRVKRIALEVFDVVRPRFSNGEPPWLVLRAASRPTTERNQGGEVHFFGVVLKHHANGRWYPLDSSTPVR